jgi:hypothetical protein
MGEGKMPFETAARLLLVADNMCNLFIRLLEPETCRSKAWKTLVPLYRSASERRKWLFLDTDGQT